MYSVPLRLHYALLLCFLISSFRCVATNRLNTVQQDTTLVKASEVAKQLEAEGKYEDLAVFCKQELKKLLNAKVKDSLEIAALSFCQFGAKAHFRDYLGSIKSTALGIKHCPKTQAGLELKGMLYYKKAYAEADLVFVKRSLKSMQKAARLLSDLEKPNGDYSIGAYAFLSQSAAYNGDLEEAKRYLRLAERMYLKDKKAIDWARTEVDGGYNRYEVILPYKKIYAFTQVANAVKDTTVTNLMETLEALHKKPEFNIKYESIFYTAALNHIGNWYATKNTEDLTTAADLKKAHYYIDKSIDYVENKGYSGNTFIYKYNKCKALVFSNRLKEADVLISDLLSRLSENDGKYPFFLAQKGLIKARMQQKDSALSTFYKAIKTIHTGDSILAKDYSNFKPNQVFGRTKLILRIAEELNKYYGNDVKVQAVIARLYYMAFIQFENTYDRSKFNKTDNELLRDIIQGVFKMKAKGFGVYHIDDNELLNRTETIQNLLAWQRFNQNRYINSLPTLDSLKQRKLELRSLLVNAKTKGEIKLQDSLYEWINKTKRITKETYPNLNLLTDKPFNIEALQNTLSLNTLVVKYMILEEDIAIYTITKDTVTMVLKPWTTKDKAAVIEFTNTIKNQKYNVDIANNLSTLLLPKIAPNIKRIIINPDGELYRLPFELLHVDTTYLIEQYKISYTSNLGFIHPDIEPHHNQQKLAIYVPDYAQNSVASVTRTSNISTLEGAKQEAELIAELFPSTIYSGSNLSKQDFVTSASKAGLLHLAMHTKVDNETPELSQLLFNDTNDNNLYLEELYGLNLSADLAVLSACNTGLGKENAGRSMESFQRAFTFAGVPATVASLWEVPDQSTRQIMESFYKYLKRGDTKSKALQLAKLDYINNTSQPKLKQPYYWAGFVLYGEDKPVVEVNEISKLWYVLLLLGLMLIFVLLLKFRKKV